VIALTGTLIGVAMSMAITVSALGAVAENGPGLSLAVPWDRLAALLAIATLAALAASVLPARRAVRDSITGNLAAD
jgi:putative ABC transport system permease protein